MIDPTHDTLRHILAMATPPEPLPANYHPSAVLLPVFWRDGDYHLVFNKRSEMVEFHKGEICFPGGGKDPEDADLLETALRETCEEMGIAPEDVEPLGMLTPTVTRTGFAIQPVVGLIPSSYSYHPSEIEVAEVLEVPFSSLLDRTNLREEASWADGDLVRGFSYTYGPHLIYGATARIVTQFLDTVAPDLGMEVPWSTGSHALTR